MKRWKQWGFVASKWSSWSCGLALAGLAVAGCAAPEAGEQTGNSAEELVNGTPVTQATENSLGLVALYHPVPNGTDWFPRPCSAIIIRSEFDSTLGWTSWVLTARHCLTVDNTITGTPRDPSSFRVIAAIAPGPALPTPPASAITPSQITVPSIFPPDTVSSPVFDLGLVRVQANWSSFVATKRGLWAGPASSLVGRTVTSYGYGIDQNLPCQISGGPPFESHGAGVARSGVFTITGSSGPTSGYSSINLQNPNNANPAQLIICGDSGGPDLATFGSIFTGVNYIVGVHSTGIVNPATSALPSLFVSQVLGGMFLKVDSETGKDLDLFGDQSALIFSPAGTAATRFQVNPSNLTIGDTNHFGQCLGVNGSTLQMQSCNGTTAQQWNYNLTTRQFVNVATNKCLHDQVTPFGSSAVIATCSSSVTNQRWTISAQR